MTRKRPLVPTARLLLGPLLLLGLAATAQAQGLVALFELSRAFDATYLSSEA